MNLKTVILSKKKTSLWMTCLKNPPKFMEMMKSMESSNHKIKIKKKVNN